VSVSPRDPYVATYTPERENQGASIKIIDITTGKTLRTHTLYKSLSCNFYWHPQGRYLAAQVDSYIKGKRRVSCLVLFRMDEREFPTQVIDEETRRITTFAWEPEFGTRFAFSSTELPETSNSFGRKGNVSIYDMRCYGSKATRLDLLKDKPSSKLSWSPQQGILLMSDLTPPNGNSEFYDVQGKCVLNVISHFNTSQSSVQWDPSGRFVTILSASAGSGDAGYSMYTFTGGFIKKVDDMHLTQFLWRPRPPCPFDAKKMQKLRENLPKYRDEFKREEQFEIDKTAQDLARKLQADKNEFQELMAKLLKQYDEDAGLIRDLYNGYDGRDPDRFIVEVLPNA